MASTDRTQRAQTDGWRATPLGFTLDDYLATETGHYLVTEAGEWLLVNSPNVANRTTRQRSWTASVDVRRQYADLDSQMATATAFAFDDYWIDHAGDYLVTEAGEWIRINTLHVDNRTIRQRVAVVTPG